MMLSVLSATSRFLYVQDVHNFASSWNNLCMLINWVLDKKHTGTE